MCTSRNGILMQKVCIKPLSLDTGYPVAVGAM